MRLELENIKKIQVKYLVFVIFLLGLIAVTGWLLISLYSASNDNVVEEEVEHLLQPVVSVIDTEILNEISVFKEAPEEYTIQSVQETNDSVQIVPLDKN